MNEHYPLLYTFHFYLFGVVAIVSAIAFVTRKSPVAAAMWLVVTMFALSAEYIMLEAHFIGIMQVLVYAGAIMVVFLFVIMLLNLGHPSEIADARGTWGKLLAGVVGLVLLAEIGVIASGGLPSDKYVAPRGFVTDQVVRYGAVGAVAKPLYQNYALAFELTSVLLLIAITGAVAVGGRRDVDAR